MCHIRLPGHSVDVFSECHRIACACRSWDGEELIMSGHVFISYSQFDQEYVTALSAYLEQAGIPVWYDYRVTTGSRFDAVIQESIDTCAAFIFVVSPNSLQSAWVDREMGYADDQGKPIFPLVLGAGGRLPIRLQNLHFEDVSDGRMPGPDTIARLQALTRATAAPPPAETTPPSSRTGEYPSYARPTPHRGQPVYAPARQRSRVPVYASVLVSVAAVSVAATFALLFPSGIAGPGGTARRPGRRRRGDHRRRDDDVTGCAGSGSRRRPGPRYRHSAQRLGGRTGRTGSGACGYQRLHHHR
jgi:hypothetical protein